MPNTPCPYGRRQAAALASMNLRAVRTPKGMKYLVVPVNLRGSSPAPGQVGPRFQPRDGSGRFISFENLHLLVASEYERTVCNNRCLYEEDTTDVEEDTTDVEEFPWGEGCPNWY